MQIFTKKWAAAAIRRAIRTWAQSAAACITVGVALSEIDWRFVLSSATVALIYSLLMSLTGLPEADGEAPADMVRNHEAEKEDEEDE